MNPILSRELRGRFRDKRSFWLLFGVSALLCLAATFIYAQATSSADTSGLYGRAISAQVENHTGRELFRFLALGNTLVWLLIAPALTATGLAQERERGLLESLWLSPFRVAAQVWGRLGAALCFLGVLQVAITPIYGIALLLGGVSVADIGFAGLIIAIGALTAASYGLFCSSRSYRGSSALGAAFFGITLWSAITYFYAQELRWFPTSFNFFVTFTHPVTLLWLLLSPNDWVPFRGGRLPISTPDALTFGLLFQLICCAILLWATTRRASKPLPDMKWSEGNRFVKKWRGALETAKTERETRREAARAREKVAGALLYEVPFEKLVRFKDPLLSREVRGRFRVRAGSTLISFMRHAAFVIAVAGWLFIGYSVIDKTSRQGVGQALVYALWGFGTLAVGVMSSGALVREREAGTWEGLHLSLLSPWEIVRSKWLSPVITFGYWSAPFWIFLPFCVDAESLGALVIVAASLFCVSAWGFFISSRAPHSAAATSWTLASLLFGLVVPLTFDSIFDISRRVYAALYVYDRGLIPLSTAYHPLVSIDHLFSLRFDFPTKTATVALNFAFNALLIAFLLWRVWKRLRRTEF